MNFSSWKYWLVFNLFFYTHAFLCIIFIGIFYKDSIYDILMQKEYKYNFFAKKALTKNKIVNF
jgi:hypothetical protein